MNACVVMTVLSQDRTGIVKTLSELVAARDGSWLESRMARLAGQFAGILRIECPQENVDALISDMEALTSEGISVQIQREVLESEGARTAIELDVVGNDRRGIVRELSAAIASVGANVEDLQTSLESAPMAGHPLFHAKGVVSLGAKAAPGDLVEAIENLGEDLAVTIR